MSQTEQLKEVLGELREAFDNYKPDAVEDDEDVMEEMAHLEALNPQTDTELKKAVSEFAYFVGEWFPDGEGEEEQEALRAVLDKASKLTS